jgi:hypothetical protein
MDLYRENLITNFQTNIYSKNNLKSLINKLEVVNNKKLTKIEISNFIDFLKKFNYNKLYKEFYDKTTNDVSITNTNDHLIKLYMIDIGKVKSSFDMHEFLKKELNDKAMVRGTTDYNFGNNKASYVNEINKASYVNEINKDIITSSFIPPSTSLPNLVSKADQIEFTKILNYQSLWRDSNILIDSRYQNISNTNRSRIVFTIVNNTKVKTPGSGVITSISNMRDIVEIEIYPFSIPYISAADNYYQKITLSILELSAISIDAYEDSQFHFIFQGKINGNLIDLTPINKTFRFFRPITRINEFSLRFGSPLSPIEFDKDRLYTQSINYATNPGIITFSEAHNLVTGDLVYVENFNTLTPAQDLNIIEEINTTQGHICTRINNTSISINVDLTQIALASQIPGLSVLVYFGSKRILLPLKFRYLIGKDD